MHKQKSTFNTIMNKFVIWTIENIKICQDIYGNKIKFFLANCLSHAEPIYALYRSTVTVYMKCQTIKNVILKKYVICKIFFIENWFKVVHMSACLILLINSFLVIFLLRWNWVTTDFCFINICTCIYICTSI